MGMIFVNRDRESLGQFTEQEISNALNSGKLLPGDLAWQEGMDSWQPLSSFENLPPPGAAPLETGVPERFKNLEPNRVKPGKIRFDECLTKGWECFAKNWGVCIVSTLVFFVLSVVVQLPAQLSQVLLEKFAGPKGADPLLLAGSVGVLLFFVVISMAASYILWPGYLYFFVSALRTKANMDDLFAGFRSSNWIQLLLAGLVQVIAIFVLLAVFIGPAIFVTSTTKSEVPLMVAAALCAIIAIYLCIGFQFVFPLIIDRGIGFWEATTTAMKTIHSNWFSAFGLLILVGLVGMSGLLLCCVGMLATAPLAYMIWGQGYRQLFGDPDSARVD